MFKNFLSRNKFPDGAVIPLIKPSTTMKRFAVYEVADHDSGSCTSANLEQTIKKAQALAEKTGKSFYVVEVIAHVQATRKAQTNYVDWEN